jgi:hypothetical protein
LEKFAGTGTNLKLETQGIFEGRQKAKAGADESAPALVVI